MTDFAARLSSPDAKITHVAFTFVASSTASDVTKTTAATQSNLPPANNVSRASHTATTAISATTAAFIPSSAPRAQGLRLIRGSSGPRIATITNAGRKIATVASTPPTTPPTTPPPNFCAPNTYPTNVAVVSSGPGVTCPTAIASTNSCALNQRCRSTNPTYK